MQKLGGQRGPPYWEPPKKSQDYIIERTIIYMNAIQRLTDFYLSVRIDSESSVRLHQAIPLRFPLYCFFSFRFGRKDVLLSLLVSPV